jgi:hypothetical protein
VVVPNGARSTPVEIPGGGRRQVEPETDDQALAALALPERRKAARRSWAGQRRRVRSSWGRRAGTYRELRRHAYERAGRAAERVMLWLLITYLACLAAMLDDLARALDDRGGVMVQRLGRRQRAP